ncbi:HEAT repeat domain-containing protein [bacterium]|nr:HEAT repeat domain-containing protein [bacterium]
MASEEEIIHALEDAVSPAVKIRILDQLGSKIKPQHRDLISHLVTLSRQEQNQEVAYSVKRALFKIRSRYNITNFPLFLMDPIRLLQSSDPACRVKALEVFEKGEVSVEQCYHFLGSLFFENDPFVLSRMMKITPILCGFIPSSRVETILEDFLDSQDSRVRANVVEALGTIRQRRSEESFERLWSCLKDPDQRVRANATSQILEDPPEGLNEFMKECMEVSQDYYELLSCKAMLRDGAIEFEEQVHEQLEKRLKKLEALLPLEEETQIAGIGMEDEGRERLRRGPMNLSLVSFFFRSQRSVWILSIFVVLSIYGYRTHQSNQALVKWNLNLEQSANKLKKNVLALKEQLQKQNSCKSSRFGAVGRSRKEYG